jgi:hypothetical protein
MARQIARGDGGLDLETRISFVFNPGRMRRTSSRSRGIAVMSDIHSDTLQNPENQFTDTL